jgi:serine protease
MALEVPMTHFRRRGRLDALCLAAAAAALWTVGAAGDAGQAGGSGRTLLQPVSAGAVDRGYLDEATPEPRAGRRSGPRDGSLSYVAGRVIVKFRQPAAGANPASRLEALRDTGATRIERPAWTDFEVLTLPDGTDAEAAAEALGRRPGVQYAQADYRVHPYFRPNDPLYARQWNLPMIGLEGAWDINKGGAQTVTVAVLDTGVAYKDALFEYTAGAWVGPLGFYPGLGRITVPYATAPDLGGGSRIVAPRDFIWNGTDPVDTDGHGTHVAGTIGQLTDNGLGAAGVAFNVRIMPVKCITGNWDDIFNSPNVGTDSVVAQAIRYAADNGAKVINLSLGRNGGPPAPVVGDAMRYAVSRGVFIAVAAGNDYEDGNPVERIAEQAAPINGAMVVAAVGPDGNRAFYSGVQSYVEIAAPGGNSRLPDGGVIQQTYDRATSEQYLLPPSLYGPPRFDVFAFRSFQGTSMATPHVAGLAALLISQGVTSPAAVEAAIKRFATDRGPAGRDDEYGAGLVDARTTLRGLGIIR